MADEGERAQSWSLSGRIAMDGLPLARRRTRGNAQQPCLDRSGEEKGDAIEEEVETEVDGDDEWDED
jgi:hypothetical protein